MKIRYKSTNTIGWASSFNLHALSEVLVTFEDGGGDSASTRDLDVYLCYKGWKDMHAAFNDGDIETDDTNTCFFEKSAIKS